MRDFLYRELSGTKFDGVEEIGDGGTLYDLDPTQKQLLAWTKAVANNDIQAKGWHNAVARTRLEGKCPVEFTLNREPTRNLLKQIGVSYPALAIWPEQSTTEGVTLDLDKMSTNWSLLYLLGPLDEAEFAKCGGVLRVFAKLFSLMVKARCHGAFEDGALQFDRGKVDVTSLRVTGAQHGTLDSLGGGQDGLAFHAVKIAFVTTETDDFVDGVDAEFSEFGVAATSVDPEGRWVAAEGQT